MVAKVDRSTGTDPSLATGSGLIGRGGEARQQMHRYTLVALIGASRLQRRRTRDRRSAPVGGA